MKIEIHCKGSKLTDAIRSHVEDKLSKLERLHRGEIDVLVVLSVNKNNREHLAEVSFNVMGQDLVAKAQADDLYKAVNLVGDQAAERLRRLKEKKRSKRKDATVRVQTPEPVGESTEVDWEDELVDEEEPAAASDEPGEVVPVS